MPAARVMIVVGVPLEHAEALLDAIAAAGGGQIGEYTHCAFMNSGSGRFKPSAAADPHSGIKETVNTVDEVRIETFCTRAAAHDVVAAIRRAHPYEEPVYYILPLLDEAEL